MMRGDDVLPEPAARRVEVFTGAGRRRRWSDEAKILTVAESYATSVGESADCHGLIKTQVFTWRREARKADECAQPSPSSLPW
jgi:transposase